LRGALLWRADEGFFRPLWSEKILDEWQTRGERQYPDMPEGGMLRQRNILTDNFEEALVSVPRELLDFPQNLLPDPNDNHVLFAALCGHADAIVTANIKDFPQNLMKDFELEVRHPDDFLLDIITLDGKRAVAALQNHRRSLTKSNPSAFEYVGRARACQLIQTHAKLQDYLDVL
jgi:predicted nucleic acid-binding protein